MSAVAVSFDAGFTLVEPQSSITETYLGVAKTLGVPIDREDFGAHLRASWRRIDRDFRSRHPTLHTSEEMERAAWREFTRAVAAPFPALLKKHARWHDLLVTHFDDPASWRPIAGAVETLDALAERDVVLAVTSNWHGALHGILEAMDLHRRFRVVLTSAEVGRKKPHAKIFRALREGLGEPRGRVLHVGDSWGDDVEGARRHGIEPVWFAPDGAAPPDEGARVARALTDVIGFAD